MVDDLREYYDALSSVYKLPYVLGEVAIGLIVVSVTLFVLVENTSRGETIIQVSWIGWIAALVVFWFFGLVINSFSSSVVFRLTDRKIDQRILYVIEEGQKAIISFGVLLALIYAILLIVISIILQYTINASLNFLSEKIIFVIAAMAFCGVCFVIFRTSAEKMQDVNRIDDDDRRAALLKGINFDDLNDVIFAFKKSKIDGEKGPA
eukprot:Cvel_2854.t1-p1 / transcript=Cvel_2854.t1 / gene=Cvel_2854 / organism=Chromera_velia_CCMP2878 / gene_product=hypothetical protein / transcript_product=hypothetical protein / location=Cvel_scaffold113:93111-93728(+) / protein_length=206 / sequence_SO=supercontig / SO=protein_coding / is_pseudo=false